MRAEPAPRLALQLATFFGPLPRKAPIAARRMRKADETPAPVELAFSDEHRDGIINGTSERHDQRAGEHGELGREFAAQPPGEHPRLRRLRTVAGVVLSPLQHRIANRRCRMKERRTRRLPELSTCGDAKPPRRAELIEHASEIAAGVRERSDPLDLVKHSRARL